MDYKITRCIKCGIKIKVKNDTIKYNCPKCGQQYEYIEAYSDEIKLIEGGE
jgi:predicted RNA-binding Zn-ribbon protein involved in translation (DUF1610 family)